MKTYRPLTHERYEVDVRCPCCEEGEVTVEIASFDPRDPVQAERITDGTCWCSDPSNPYIRSHAYWEEVARRAEEKERVDD